MRTKLPWHIKKQSSHIKIHGGLLEYARRNSESIGRQVEKGLMLYHGLKEIPELTPKS